MIKFVFQCILFSIMAEKKLLHRCTSALERQKFTHNANRTRSSWKKRDLWQKKPTILFYKFANYKGTPFCLMRFYSEMLHFQIETDFIISFWARFLQGSVVARKKKKKDWVEPSASWPLWPTTLLNIGAEQKRLRFRVRYESGLKCLHALPTVGRNRSSECRIQTAICRADEISSDWYHVVSHPSAEVERLPVASCIRNHRNHQMMTMRKTSGTVFIICHY